MLKEPHTRPTGTIGARPNSPAAVDCGDRLLDDAITIVMVTRNRPELVRDVVVRLRVGPFRTTRLVITDDASDVPLRLVDDRVRLTRNTTRQGLVVSRTAANLSVETEFVLSLDDDSWPAGGDLRGAVAHMRANRDLLALGFPIRNRGGHWQVKSRQHRPYPVRAFVGCAHLVRVDHFRALGGYGAAVVHQGEELELAARGFRHGLRCQHFPGFTVHHDVTPVSRDVDRMLFHDGRNKVRFLRKFCPRAHLPWRLLMVLGEMVIFSRRNRRWSPLRGWKAGMGEAIESTDARFTHAQWCEWRSMPYA